MLRDDNFSVSGSLGKAGSGYGRRMYSQQDANWNVTSLVDTSGAVQLRTVYDAYGNSSGLSSGPYEWMYGYQGGHLDLFYRFGVRDYDPGFHRWMEPDPAGYVNGANVYQMELSNPVNGLDPTGLAFLDNFSLYGGGTMPYIPPNRLAHIPPAPPVPPGPPTTGSSGAGSVGIAGGLMAAGTIAIQSSAESAPLLGPADIPPALAGVGLLGLGGAIRAAQNGAYDYPGAFEDPAYYTPWGRPEQVFHQSNLANNSNTSCPADQGQGLQQPTTQPAQAPRARLQPGKGGRFYDAPSQADLRNKSLNSGTTELNNAGLTRKRQPDGSYNFVDDKGKVRARWVPQSGNETPHWSKFEASGDERHYLDNSGRQVDGRDDSHRIPSK